MLVDIDDVIRIMRGYYDECKTDADDMYDIGWLNGFYNGIDLLEEYKKGHLGKINNTNGK